MFTIIPVSAAETDDSGTGAVTVYQIFVGKTAVTSDNCRNIRTTVRTASCEPNTNTLTLNNPKLTEMMYADEGVNYINRKDNVKIKDNCQISGAIAKCGIESVAPISLNGNFTFIGKRGGAASNQSVSIISYFSLKTKGCRLIFRLATASLYGLPEPRGVIAADI